MKKIIGIAVLLMMVYCTRQQVPILKFGDTLGKDTTHVKKHIMIQNAKRADLR